MRTKILPILIIAGIVINYSFSFPNSAIDRYITIKLLNTYLISNNGVGHDWDNFLSIHKQVIRKGEKITIKLEQRAPLTIKAYAIEEDKNYSDTGEKETTFPYSDLIAIKKSKFEVKIKVMENGGANAGNYAEWKYIFELVGRTKK